MAEITLFSIGEVAKLFHISVSSLRYYESVGLLIPEYVNPESGYRYYSARQFEVLNTLRYLRALDLPLHEIQEFLQNRDIDVIEQKLRQQKQLLMQKQQELARIEHKINHRLRQLSDAQHADLDEITLIEYPACRLVWIEDALTLQNLWDMEAPIRRLESSPQEPLVFLGKVGVGISAEHLRQADFSQYDCVFLVLDEEDRFDGETVSLPAAQCVRVRFRGSHPQAAQVYLRLLEYIRAQQLELCGFSREITLIDYGITSDPEKFVTEICIPVRPLNSSSD